MNVTSNLLLGNNRIKMAAVSPCCSESSSSSENEMPEDHGSGHTNLDNNQYEEIPMDEYDASVLTPVFFGRFPRRIDEILHSDSVHMSSDSQMHLNLIKSTQSLEATDSLLEYDPAVIHPATFGYVLLDKKHVLQEEEEEEILKPLPDPLKCKLRRY